MMVQSTQLVEMELHSYQYTTFLSSQLHHRTEPPIMMKWSKPTHGTTKHLLVLMEVVAEPPSEKTHPFFVYSRGLYSNKDGKLEVLVDVLSVCLKPLWHTDASLA